LRRLQRRRHRRQIDSYTIDYDVQTSGVVKVKKHRLPLRAERRPARHQAISSAGAVRQHQDAVYKVEHISVDSPDGAPTFLPDRLRQRAARGSNSGSGLVIQTGRSQPDGNVCDQLTDGCHAQLRRRRVLLGCDGLDWAATIKSVKSPRLFQRGRKR
jgi:hypothetical protein